VCCYTFFSSSILVSPFLFVFLLLLFLLISSV
jgi:hypothetical protein